jgi:hypothetical protein
MLDGVELPWQANVLAERAKSSGDNQKDMRKTRRFRASPRQSMPEERDVETYNKHSQSVRRPGQHEQK